MKAKPLTFSAASAWLGAASVLALLLSPAWAQTGPSIIQQPASQNIPAGARVALSVTVAGTGPLTYQWQFNGTNLPGNFIITVAGNGSPGYSGDGGVATNAGLNNPTGVTLDSSGNLYISDFNNNRVRKVDAAGFVTTVAGEGSQGYSGDGGAATNAALSSPLDVAMDASGNLFISDLQNNRVRKVDTKGIITTVAGNGLFSYSGDGGAATNASLSAPFGVAVDLAGNLFIADTYDYFILEVDTNGLIRRAAGHGSASYSGDGAAAIDAGLNYPTGVALDSSGNLYIADFDNNRVRKVDADGLITTVAGNGSPGYSGDRGAATNASLSGPIAIAVDSSGNLFISDQGNNRIRKIDVSGVITTVAGNGSVGYSGDGGAATNATFSTLYGLAVDAAGNLFIADERNARIRKVPLGNAPTLAINRLSEANAGDYRVIVSSPYGSVTSSNALLSVLPSPAPSIITQPASQTVSFDATASFSVTATGPPPLSYQWFLGTNAVAGATSSVLNLTNVIYTKTGDYSVVVNNAGGSVTSSNALLALTAPPIGTNVFDLAADFSTTQNPNGPWTYGGFDIFSVFHPFTNSSAGRWNDATAISVGPGGQPQTVLCYDYVAGSDPSDRSSPVILAELFIAPQGSDGTYALDLSAYGIDIVFPDQVSVSMNGQPIATLKPTSVYPTNNFSLTYVTVKAGDILAFEQTEYSEMFHSFNFEAVLSQPRLATAVTVQPLNQTVLLQGAAAFNVTASGLPPLNYQWMFGTNTIAGATNPTLNLTNVQYAQAGNYSVLLTGPEGSMASSNALLTVLAPLLPTITKQPTNQTVTVGTGAAVTVAVAGSAPLTFQWFVGASGDTSSPIAGATNSVFNTAQLYTSASFWVSVQNAYGSVKSASALVTVVPENSVQLGFRLTAGFPTLTIFGNAGTSYHLKYKTNLQATNWSPLLNVLLSTNSYTFTDSGFTNSPRFYRVRSSP